MFSLPSGLAELGARDPEAARWAAAIHFVAEAGAHCLLPAADGTLRGVLLGLGDEPIWDWGALPSALSALGVILLVSDGMRTSAAIHAVMLKGRSRNLRTACDALYHALAVSLLLTVASAVIEGLLYKLLGSFLGS